MASKINKIWHEKNKPGPALGAQGIRAGFLVKVSAPPTHQYICPPNRRAPNKMPAKATIAQKLKWHKAHANACGCRPMPKNLKDEYWKHKKHILTDKEHACFMKETKMTKKEHDAWHKEFGGKHDL